MAQHQVIALLSCPEFLLQGRQGRPRGLGSQRCLFWVTWAAMRLWEPLAGMNIKETCLWKVTALVTSLIKEGSVSPEGYSARVRIFSLPLRF